MAISGGCFLDSTEGLKPDARHSEDQLIRSLAWLPFLAVTSLVRELL